MRKKYEEQKESKNNSQTRISTNNKNSNDPNFQKKLSDTINKELANNLNLEHINMDDQNQSTTKNFHLEFSKKYSTNEIDEINLQQYNSKDTQRKISMRIPRRKKPTEEMIQKV